MPTVPIYTSPTPAKLETSSGEVALKASGSSGPIRQQLAQAVRQQISQHGTVSVDFLDRLALTRLDQSAADTPAAWDYAALRHTAQREQQQQQLHAQQMQQEEETAWTRQVGVLTSDNSALEAYLSAQLPAYQKRLQHQGVSAEQAAKVTARLRAQTVEEHISRSLRAGDWQTAAQVLTAQQAHLTDDIRQRYAQQVQSSFAQDCANRLWQQAWQSAGQDVAAAREQALSLVQEPQEELRENIKGQINCLATQQAQQVASARAQVFDRLAYAQNPSQMRQIITEQTVLDSTQLTQVQQALQQQDMPASATQQTWFVTHYFDTQADAEKALEKGWCNARDYFRLKAAQQARQSGQTVPAGWWICRGIQTWMNKQGFGEDDITRASYAVLCNAKDDAGRLELWKQIKTLLTC